MAVEATQSDFTIVNQSNDALGVQTDFTVTDIDGGDSPHRYWRLLMIRGISAGNGYTQINELQLRESSGGPSVATGGTASSSTQYGGQVASNAFDGNTSTYWESASVGSSGDLPPARGTWLKYDLGSGNAKLITEVSILVSAYVDEGPLDFLIQYSDDDTNWTSKGRFRAALPWVPGTPQVFALSRPEVTGRRYWRLYSIDSQAGSYTTVREIVLNEYAGGPDRAFPAYTSCDGSFTGYQSWKATDQDAATAWGTPTGSPHPHWWQVDHSEGYGFQCDTYSLTCHDNPGEMVKDWELQFSDNGSTWTTAHSVTGEASWTAGETRTYTTTNNGGSGGPPPAPLARRRPVIVACGD